VETLIYPRILKYLTWQGWEKLTANGNILVGTHYGSWELYNFFIAQHVPYAVLAKPQKHTGLDKFLNDLRREDKLKVSFSLKDLIRYLKNKFTIGIVVDHGAEENAPLVDFFSYPVPTPATAVHLARKFGLKIYPSIGQRKNGFNHEITIGQPQEINNKTDQQILQEINAFYQQRFIQEPKQYFWHYKRFKKKKITDILILSDNKPGHVKQSLALANMIKEQTPVVRLNTIVTVYNNYFCRYLSETCAFISSNHCLGCGRCLNLILPEKTAQQIFETYADIVIGTGSYVSSLIKIVSAYLGAKSIAVLRPNIPMSRFDLTVIPEHDRIQANNTAIIKGALAYPQNASEKLEHCRSFFKLSNDKKIALVMGGVLSEQEEFLRNFRTFAEKLKSYAKTNHYKLLITTSRRTPQEVEQIIEQQLQPLAEAIVYPAKANYDFVFEGFIMAADYAFITGDSISMISETAALGKPFTCLILEKMDYKRKLFFESCQKNMDFLENPYNIEITNFNAPDIFEYNKKSISQGLKRIL
jgi:mitochondrial fission protein ELM1